MPRGVNFTNIGALAVMASPDTLEHSSPHTCSEACLLDSIKNESTASGGETPRGSAVPGVHLSHQDLWHMHGTLFRPGLWHCEVRVSTVPGEDLSRRCILGQENHQRDQDQCELNLDSTQRPLQGAFLIPPAR